jgi:hypothetical protein
MPTGRAGSRSQGYLECLVDAILASLSTRRRRRCFLAMSLALFRKLALCNRIMQQYIVRDVVAPPSIAQRRWCREVDADRMLPPCALNVRRIRDQDKSFMLWLRRLRLSVGEAPNMIVASQHSAISVSIQLVDRLCCSRTWK